MTWAGYLALPAPQGTAIEMITPQHPTESSGTAAPAVYQWSVKDHANAMITGTNNGFFVKDKDPSATNGNEGANQWLRSKEYATVADRPKLVVAVQ